MRVILVPVADRPECAVALDHAFDLAARVGADVSGCHFRAHREDSVTIRRASEKAEVSAEALFNRLAGVYGRDVVKRASTTSKAPVATWQAMVGDAAHLMPIVGPMSDLIVVSRPKKRSKGPAGEIMEEAITQSGRPVLVLPQHAKGVSGLGSRVIIAWNQSRDAADAVKMAVPVLRAAEQVTLFTSGTEHRLGPKSSHIRRYLAHHGVKTTVVRGRGLHEREELIDAYAETGSNLVLMGAYSKARWRQRIFGGMTEYMMRNAEVPVLLRHG